MTVSGSLVYTIQQANVPFIMTKSDLPDCDYVMQADIKNTGIINVCGDYGVVSAGYPLRAGDFVSLKTENLNRTYISGTVAGDSVHVLYSSDTTYRDLLTAILQQLQTLNAKIKC